VTGVDGETTRYGYDGSGRITTVTDPYGNTVLSNEYNSVGQVIRQTDAVGAQTTFSYDGGETDVTAPDGGVWTDAYVKNVLQARYDPFGNKISFGYTYRLDLVATTDALGNTTETSFDVAGRVRHVEGPISRESWTYSSATGLVSSYFDRTRERTNFAYGADGMLASATDPLAQTTSYTYTEGGLPLTVTSPGGGTTSYAYDAAGNPVSVTSPTGGELTQTFDDAGRVVSITDPRGNAEGADPADFTTHYTYDTAGNLLSVTDAEGNTTAYRYDAAGRPVEMISPARGDGGFRYRMS
jgi:YD repeat-containing protein